LKFDGILIIQFLMRQNINRRNVETERKRGNILFHPIHMRWKTMREHERERERMRE